jgi:alpha-galactosidase/6-phospho-beta-glucosidase family protein
VVEVPAYCDGRGVHPVAVGEISEPHAAYIRTQLTIQRLTTEAYRTRSKNLLLQALLLDPAVNSILQAERLLDEMLDLQQAFLPEFS